MTASNTERVRTGERPTCFNRPDYPATQTVNDGWTWDGMLQLTSVPNPMSKHCASWSVAEHENPAEEAIPAQQNWRCKDCRHLPQDPRVIERAQQSEAHK
jgi:hypothetical protein